MKRYLPVLALLAGCGEPAPAVIDPGVQTQWMHDDATLYELRVYKNRQAAGSDWWVGHLVQAANCAKVDGEWVCHEQKIHRGNE
jgi:hypothetical protein